MKYQALFVIFGRKRQNFNCRLLQIIGGALAVNIASASQVRLGHHHRERSGSVVECLTRDRGVAGSSFTGVTALWPLSKTHLS